MLAAAAAAGAGRGRLYFRSQLELSCGRDLLAAGGCEVVLPADHLLLCPAVPCCGLQFKRCENLPNKKQLQATIARLLKQPATRIATGTQHWARHCCGCSCLSWLG